MTDIDLDLEDVEGFIGALVARSKAKMHARETDVGRCRRQIRRVMKDCAEGCIAFNAEDMHIIAADETDAVLYDIAAACLDSAAALARTIARKTRGEEVQA